MPITHSGVQLVDDQGPPRAENGPANGSTKQRGRAAAGAASDQTRQVATAARRQSQDVTATARDQARDVTATAKEQAAQLTHELSQQGRMLVDETRGQVEQQAEAQTQELARTLHRWGSETQALAEGRPEDAGATGEYAAQLADKFHELATGLENRGVSGLIEEVQDFARRRPGAFLVTTALIGFGGGRLIRSARSAGDESAFEEELAPAPARPASSRAATARPTPARSAASRSAPAGRRRVPRAPRNPASLGGG